jgi:predicted metal-dependent HD superfamily phosphohydrolase
MLSEVLATEKYWTSDLFPEEVFRELVTAYSQPHRYYHNLKHIQQVLDTVNEMRSLANNFVAIQLAAWFHDVIYNPQAKDNEEKSAAYARTTLTKIDVSPETIEKVEKMILMTKTHQAPSNDIDTQIFLDADLSMLGSSSLEYQAYARAIRQEYAWVSEKEYRLKRKQVLEKFLQRKRIYLTDYFFNKLEARSRENIQAEIRDFLFD